MAMQRGTSSAQPSLGGGRDSPWHLKPSYPQRLCHGLMGLWRYKDEDCEACRTYFSLGTGSLDIPVPDPRVFEPGRRARCHGCCIARFAVSFFSHIIAKKGLGRLSEVTIFIEPDVIYTTLTMDAISQADGRAVRVHLEILKTTHANERSSWLRWMFGWYTPGPRGDLPLYLRNTFEAVPTSGHTGSPAAFEKIFAWFRACSSSHEACGNNSEPPLLPTRVIHIPQKGQVRLVEGEGQRSHYVCLSHRWLALAEMSRCTQSNIGSLMDDIPMDWLTATFQDAISFVRRLSEWYTRQYPGQDPIEYIWIDSLCIIQDSTEDWDKESKKMWSIYEGAIITVAAAVGPKGCFSEAEQTHRGFDVTNPQRKNPRLYLREPLPNHDNHDKSLGVPTIRTSSLDLLNRGWVLQERLLSRRFVLFTPNEVMWECFDTSDCECGRLRGEEAEPRPGALPYRQSMREFVLSHQAEDPNYLVRPTPFKVAYHTSLKEEGGRRERNLRNWWRRLVETYSFLSLTKESDRLPAITGLATQFAWASGMGHYVAGHFLAGLPLDLAWYTEIPDEQSRKEAGVGPVPSWSWASCGARVQMPREASPFHTVLPTLISAPSTDHLMDGLETSASLGIRCSAFENLNDKPGSTDFPLVKTYYPDIASYRTMPTEGTKYVLLLQDTELHSWLLLHVGPINAERLRFRRLGMLELKPRFPEPLKASITEVTLRSCFSTMDDLELELV